MLKSDYADFYALFQKYSAAVTLNDRFTFYKQMAALVFTSKSKQWSHADSILVKKDFSIASHDDPAEIYAKRLI